MTTGYCYLLAVNEGVKEVVRGELAEWPTFGALLQSSSDWFLSYDDLWDLCVEFGDDGNCHLVTSAVASVDSKSFGAVLGDLAGRTSDSWKSGTLGELFVGKPSVYVGYFSEVTLSSRCGGDGLDWHALCKSVFSAVPPSDVGSADAVRLYSEYYTAVVSCCTVVNRLKSGGADCLVEQLACDGKVRAGAATCAGVLSEPSVVVGAVSSLSERCVPVLGPNGGISVGRGLNYVRNQENRRRRKEQKGKGSGERILSVKTELQQSLEEKWRMENELAVEQAKRKLELLKSRDLESEKRMQRAQIMRTTEAAKVQTERAYASLKRTGNVPGFAETVVTDGSCPALSPSRSDGTCISPDSSVSQQEIRAMMKENEDLKLTLKRIERDNPALVAHHMEGHGVKTAFTLDSDGMCPVDEPGCMGIDGKYHLDSYERNPKFYKDRFRAEEATERYFNRE